jgi:hypothetical protein
MIGAVVFALIGPALQAGFGLAAEEISFQDVWSRVRTEGRTRAASLDLRASTVARERADRHIYPRVYLDARGFNSNDPTQSFMAKLAQRSAQLSDFLPSRLNAPGSTTLGKASIGLDLPLYEGGAKAAMAKVQENLETSRKEELAFTVREEYAAALSMYAALLILEDAESRLTNLDAQMNEILGRYQIGNAGNPVGYSGLLGMRALKNRVSGMKLNTSARKEAARNTLEAMSNGLPAGWKHSRSTVASLLSQHFGTQQGITISHRTRALEAAVRMKENMVDVETSRFLPRAGVFSEASGFAGQRKSASAYNVGVYVTMNLFSAQDIGARSQASLESEAMAARARDMRLREEAEARTLQSGLQSLEKSMALLEESEGLLNEQTRSARELYRTGAINLMQYVEVLSRRADIIEQRMNLMSEYTRTRAGLFLLAEGPVSGDSLQAPAEETK